MRIRARLIFLFLLVAGAACACAPSNTLPRPVSPTAPVQHFNLEIPPDLEIKGADFSATALSDGSGGELVPSNVSGRAFLIIFAVHRTTGEQFLLLYEDIVRRKQPVYVVRFRRGTEQARPDSTR